MENSAVLSLQLQKKQGLRQLAEGKTPWSMDVAGEFSLYDDSILASLVSAYHSESYTERE